MFILTLQHVFLRNLVDQNSSCRTLSFLDLFFGKNEHFYLILITLVKLFKENLLDLFSDRTENTSCNHAPFYFKGGVLQSRLPRR